MLTLQNTFPLDVVNYLHRYGEVTEVRSLHGLSINRIWRVCFPDLCVVIKVNAREAAFYRYAAPHLSDVPMPELMASIDVDDAQWLVMEFLPEPFPRERWLADADVLNVLATLHQIPLDSIDCPSLFEPKWDETMTEAMFAFFPDEVRETMAPKLNVLRTQARVLFEPQCYISGDPNPNNWGLRADGSVALFDWERFGKGTPALDLGITVPGLGQASDFERVAKAYDGDVSAESLALAKAWTVIEFFANVHDGEVGNTEMIDRLMEIVPAWVDTIAVYCE